MIHIEKYGEKAYKDMPTAREYREELVEDIRDHMQECVDDGMCHDDVVYMKDMLKTLRLLDEYADHYMGEARHHEARRDRAESERHRSAVEGERESRSGHKDTFEHDVEKYVDDIEHTFEMYFKGNATMEHVVEEISELIECIYEHGGRDDREKLKRMLRDLRSKHVI